MIELPDIDIHSMRIEERIGLATMLCFKTQELLEGIAQFEWDIGCEEFDIEGDGQPDDYQENSDFSHDDYFDNMEATDDGFLS